MLCSFFYRLSSFTQLLHSKHYSSIFDFLLSSFNYILFLLFFFSIVHILMNDSLSTGFPCPLSLTLNTYWEKYVTERERGWIETHLSPTTTTTTNDDESCVCFIFCSISVGFLAGSSRKSFFNHIANAICKPSSRRSSVVVRRDCATDLQYSASSMLMIVNR